MKGEALARNGLAGGVGKMKNYWNGRREVDYSLLQYLENKGRDTPFQTKGRVDSC